MIARHSARLSGPLIDRIDIILRVGTPPREELMSDEPMQRSSEIRRRVIAARERQAERLAGTAARCNAEMKGMHVGRFCTLTPEARTTLYDAHQRIKLSGRAHFRLLRVARTLADLDGRDRIERKDVAEAVGYRSP